MASKRQLDEQSKTIEQFKTLIDELQLRHERKERELLKRIAVLYHDLQQSRKKMAHLIYKHQQPRKVKANPFEGLLFRVRPSLPGRHFQRPSCLTETKHMFT